MATPRSWMERSEEILMVLRRMQAPQLDRDAISELFQLQRRASIELLKAAGAKPVNKTLFVERGLLIGWVERVAKEEAWQISRRQDLKEELSREVAEIQALRSALAREERRQVSFPLVQEVLSATCDSLPSGIKLEAGRVTILITPDAPQLMAETFCQLLYSLGTALASDFSTFEERVLAPLLVSPDADVQER